MIEKSSVNVIAAQIPDPVIQEAFKDQDRINDLVNTRFQIEDKKNEEILSSLVNMGRAMEILVEVLLGIKIPDVATNVDFNFGSLADDIATIKDKVTEILGQGNNEKDDLLDHKSQINSLREDMADVGTLLGFLLGDAARVGDHIESLSYNNSTVTDSIADTNSNVEQVNTSLATNATDTTTQITNLKNSTNTVVDGVASSTSSAFTSNATKTTTAVNAVKDGVNDNITDVSTTKGNTGSSFLSSGLMLQDLVDATSDITHISMQIHDIKKILNQHAHIIDYESILSEWMHGTDEVDDQGDYVYESLNDPMKKRINFSLLNEFYGSQFSRGNIQSVNTTTNLIGYSSSYDSKLSNGDMVLFQAENTSSSLPGGLEYGVPYWVHSKSGSPNYTMGVKRYRTLQNPDLKIFGDAVSHLDQSKREPRFLPWDGSNFRSWERTSDGALAGFEEGFASYFFELEHLTDSSRKGAKALPENTSEIVLNGSSGKWEYTFKVRARLNPTQGAGEQTVRFWVKCGGNSRVGWPLSGSNSGAFDIFADYVQFSSSNYSTYQNITVKWNSDPEGGVQTSQDSDIIYPFINAVSYDSDALEPGMCVFATIDHDNQSAGSNSYYNMSHRSVGSQGSNPNHWKRWYWTCPALEFDLLDITSDKTGTVGIYEITLDDLIASAVPTQDVTTDTVTAGDVTSGTVSGPSSVSVTNPPAGSKGRGTFGHADVDTSANKISMTAVNSTVSDLADGDNIFFRLNSSGGGDTIPGGITQGNRYYVKNKETSSLPGSYVIRFQIAENPGAVAVDITSQGQGTFGIFEGRPRKESTAGSSGTATGGGGIRGADASVLTDESDLIDATITEEPPAGGFTLETVMVVDDNGQLVRVQVEKAVEPVQEATQKLIKTPTPTPPPHVTYKTPGLYAKSFGR